MAPVGDLCLLACAVPHTTKAAYGHVMRSMASQHCVQEQPGGNNVQGGSCADATATLDCVLPCMARHSTVFNDSRALGCRGFARGLVLHAA